MTETEAMIVKQYQTGMCVQIQPAHADKISGYDYDTRKGNPLEMMLANENCVAQRKHDGERIKMHFCQDQDGKAYVVMDSRRISKKTGMYKQCQENFDCFNSLVLEANEKGELVGAADLSKSISLMRQFGYTVLDGELKATRKGQDSWSDIVGVIHSLPERAKQLQASGEFEVSYNVFDCMFVNGHDIRELSYGARLEVAKMVVECLSKATDKIKIVDSSYVKTKEELYEMRDKQVAMGHEGIVVKSLNRKYSDVGAYIKAKRCIDADLVVYAYEAGNGKYSNTVGALKCGYYDPKSDSIVHVTDVNCGTDQDRAEWLQGFKDCSRANGVLEVKCQEVTESSLRHPVYVRYRPDKDFKMCTRETIFKKEEEHE